MKHYKFLVILLYFLLISSFTQAGQLETFSYAYIYRDDTGESGIIVLSPPENAARQIRLPSDSISEFAPSVGHEWVGLTSRNRENYQHQLILVNILTAEVRRVAFEGVGLYKPVSIKGEPQNIVWSPDGKYLALNLADNTNENFTITTHLYTLADNTLIALPREGIDATRLAWSNDGRYLAAAGYRCKNTCASSLDLESQLDIFDVTTQSWSSTIPLTEQISGARTDAGLCELAWSPNDVYISLIATCDSLDYGQYQEVYLIEVHNLTIQRLTDFTYTQDHAAQNGFLVARYKTSWVADNLLISAVHGFGAENKAETFLYATSTNTRTPLYDGFISASDWQAQTGRLIIQTGSNNTMISEAWRGVDSLNISSLRDVNTLSLDPLPISSEVCILDQSPDGRYVAYAMPSSNLCPSNIQEIRFLEYTETGVVPITIEASLPNIMIVKPIGWMRTQ